MSKCRYCMRARDVVYPIGRFGGGTYRRAGRYYRSSICGECAVHLHENGWSSRFDSTALARIAEKLRREAS